LRGALPLRRPAETRRKRGARRDGGGSRAPRRGRAVYTGGQGTGRAGCGGCEYVYAQSGYGYGHATPTKCCSRRGLFGSPAQFADRSSVLALQPSDIVRTHADKAQARLACPRADVAQAHKAVGVPGAPRIHRSREFDRVGKRLSATGPSIFIPKCCQTLWPRGPITIPIIRARCPRCAHKWPAAYVLRCTERFSMPRVLRCLTLEGRSAFPADRHWVRVIYPLWMMTTPHVLCICAGDGNFSAVAACLCAGARSCGTLDIYQLQVHHFRTMTNSPRCMLT
jgi:hypothetical protein